MVSCVKGRRHWRAARLLGWLLLANQACAPKVVGRCTDPDCIAASCEAAAQQLPESCDAGARTCGGAIVDDEAECDECQEVRRRLRIGNAKTEVHMQCACRFCAVQLAACVISAAEEGGDPVRDGQCLSILQCGLATGCSGTECYCGKGVDQVTCIANANGDAGAQGLCAGTIAAAGGCTDAAVPGDCVLRQRYDLNTAIGRAVAVGSCSTGDPVVGIDGYCPFETTLDR